MAASAPSAGKSPLLTLWLQDAVGNKLDPNFCAHELPLQQYAKCCYEEWIPLDILQKAFDETDEKVQKANFAWNNAEGPIAASILTARRLEWTFESATVLKTHAGHRLELTIDSPAFITQQATLAVRRMIDKEITTEFPALGARANGPITSGFRKLFRKHKNITSCTPTGPTNAGRP